MGPLIKTERLPGDLPSLCMSSMATSGISSFTPLKIPVTVSHNLMFVDLLSVRLYKIRFLARFGLKIVVSELKLLY